MLKDLGTVGVSLTDLVGNAGDEKMYVKNIPEPPKPLPLKAVEAGVKNDPSIANTPLGL